MDQQSVQPVQPQVDLLGVGSISLKAVLNIFQALAESDVQGLVLPPLQSLGQWLSVDRNLISHGMDVLRTKNSIRSFVGVVFGFSGSGLAKILRENIHWTSSFLFIIAGSPCFGAEEMGILIYDILALKSMLNLGPVSSTHIVQFVRDLYGYRDVMGEHSPLKLYTEVGGRIMGKLGHPDTVPGLERLGPINELAKIIVKVFDELQDAANEYVTMDGWRTGLWIATVFLWLRPHETQLSLNSEQIYPDLGSGERRLRINLIRQLEDGDFNHWSIHTWRGDRILGQMFRIPDDIDSPIPLHHYPLSAARDQMTYSGVSPGVLEATGYIAAALVDVACQQGCLCDKEGSKSLIFHEICSAYFLESYHGILQHFGWTNLDNELQNGIASALHDQISKARVRPANSVHNSRDNLDFLREEIQECIRNSPETREAFRLISIDRLGDATERAIFLAVEALLFGFCFKRPLTEIYRPYTSNKLLSHAKILRDMLFKSRTVSDNEPPRMQGYSFWDFRQQAIKAMLDGISDVDPSAIAVSSNGYVVFSAALIGMDSDMTDPRKVSAIYVVPGAIKLEREPGQFDKIVEGSKLFGIIARSLSRRERPIELFRDGKFCGLTEDTAYDKQKTEVKHLTSVVEDSFRGRVLQLQTCLNPISAPDADAGPRIQTLLAPSTRVLVPTSWIKSIEAITFAKHIRVHSMSRREEEPLSKLWQQKGYLLSDNMQWCLVGHGATKKRRHISTTCLNEQLRFFESGNLAEGRMVFIKHKGVPLIQCIKEAIETCRDNPEWVIIS